MIQSNLSVKTLYHSNYTQLTLFQTNPPLLTVQSEKQSAAIPQSSDAIRVRDAGPAHCVAIDCEMVCVGPRGRHSQRARVSIVDSMLKCVYDKFVKPREAVTDYRTKYSGIRPKDLVNGLI